MIMESKARLDGVVQAYRERGRRAEGSKGPEAGLN